MDEFFSENREAFKRIKNAIDSLPHEMTTDELREFSRVIAAAIQDPRVLLDFRTGCNKLADAIIAVDSLGFGTAERRIRRRYGLVDE